MHFQSNDSEPTSNDPTAFFKKGVMIQLAHIFNWLGQTFVLAIVIIIPLLILWFYPQGEACVVSATLPVIAGAFTSAALVFLLGNPFIGIFAGVVLGLILNIPLIQHLLCK